MSIKIFLKSYFWFICSYSSTIGV